MIINDLDLLCLPVGTHKADAVLIIDSYAVLSLPVTSERFQPVPRRGGQVFKTRSGVKHYEFSVRSLLNGLRNSSGMLPFEDFLSFFVVEARYHDWMI